MNLTTKNNEFRQWIKENYSIVDPNELKPQEIHDKFLVYLAWRQAEHKQPPNKKQEKLQQYLTDIN